MQFQKQPSEGQICALIFAGTQCQLQQQPMSIIQSFCYQQSFRDAITGSGKTKPFVRKLLGNWIERAEDAPAYQAMMLAMQYDLTEGLTPAKKILESGNQQPYIQQFALLSVARFGTAEHVPLMEKAMDNTTVIGNTNINGKRKVTQLRDVALACMIHVSKQKHKDFGFDEIQEAAPYLFNISTIGFEDDARRDEAIKKWKEFAKTLKSGTPAEASKPETKPEEKPAPADPAQTKEAVKAAARGIALPVEAVPAVIIELKAVAVPLPAPVPVPIEAPKKP